jgi:hypothetical protein
MVSSSTNIHNACLHADDDLLDVIFELMNKDILGAKMKIVLSLNGSGDNIEEFLKSVDDDVSRMRTLPSGLLSTASTIGQVLKTTKVIIDQVTKVTKVVQQLFEPHNSKSAD